MIKSLLASFIFLASIFGRDNEPKITIVLNDQRGTIESLKGHVRLFVESFEAEGHFPKVDSLSIDEKGNCVSESVSDEAGLYYSFKFNYKYDLNGKKSELLAGGWKIYKYDSDGLIAEWVGGQKDPVNENCKFKYNSSGELIESRLYIKGTLVYLTKYKYDKRFLLVETMGYLGHQFGDKPSYFVKTRYDYKLFDQKGNWTKVVLNYWNHRDTVTRKISYY